MNAKPSVAQILLRAVAHTHAGEIEAARDLCESALALLSLQAMPARFPKLQAQMADSKLSTSSCLQEQVSALVALYNEGKLELVAEQALVLTRQYPQAPRIWNMLGAASAGLGRLDQASLAYRQACELQPDFAEAHNNLGNALIRQGKLEEAAQSCRRALAIKPDYVAAHYNLGSALQEQGRLAEAERSYRRALDHNPAYAAAYYNLGNVLRKQGKLKEAERSYQQALELKPDLAEVHNNLGYALRGQGKLDEAERSFRRALEIRPDEAVSHNSLGIALRDQGKLEEAERSYRRALELKPDLSKAHYNLGNVLREQGKLNEAEQSFRRALEFEPDDALTHNNLGVTLLDQGKLEEAKRSYRHALSIKADDAEVRFNLSIILLLSGKIRDGFEEYEWRWKRGQAPHYRKSKKPLWMGGQLLKNRTILLWGEQGLGDQIQFARYASCVAEKGARVILEVQDPLVDLFRSMKDVLRVVDGRTPVADEEFDFHCPLMSLPLALGTDLNSIPKPMRLVFSQEKLDYFSNRLLKASPKIGIVWSGNTLHKNDHNRSIMLKNIFDLISIPVTWISLQKEVRSSDRDVLDATANIHHFGDELAEFSSTAALCQQCDLVISVDTSVAHLAATLGRPVWLLLPFAPDWRWLLERDDSPWYPTMKLYRQESIGDWGGVIGRVKADLITWLSQFKNSDRI